MLQNLYLLCLIAHSENVGQHPQHICRKFYIVDEIFAPQTKSPGYGPAHPYSRIKQLDPFTCQDTYVAISHFFYVSISPFSVCRYLAFF